jgi:hypothetical protein
LVNAVVAGYLWFAAVLCGYWLAPPWQRRNAFSASLWRRDDELPVVERTLDAIVSLTTQRHWW